MKTPSHSLGSVAAVVTRGSAVEAWHSASVAVVDENAQLSRKFGDPELVVMTRSSLKPFQALALVTSGAADALGLDSEELALCCASHNGSDAHVRVAQRLLDKAGAKASDLQCGAHLPIGLRLAGRDPKAGEDRDPLRNACSGKHSGFLALARHLGEPLETYLQPDSQVQSRVRASVALACGVLEADLPCGIDGCSAPNYALPLSQLALGMLRLAHPAHAPRELAGAFERVRDAMLAHPLLVSGEQRLDYDLSRAFPNNLVCKVGAEGLELCAFRDPPLAFAVKVHDGSERALGPLCVSLIEELVLCGQPMPAALEPHRRPIVRNHRKLETGAIVATLTLEPVLGA